MKQFNEQYKGMRVVENPIKTIDMKCHRCEHEWRFSGIKLKHLGKYPVYAQCPNCMTSVKVKFKEEDSEKNDS